MNDVLKGTIIETYVNHIVVKLKSGKCIKVGNKFLKFYPSVRDKVVIYHINNTYKVFKETVSNFNLRKSGSLFLVSFALIYGFSIVVNQSNVEVVSGMLNDTHSISKSDMKEKANALIDNVSKALDKDLATLEKTMSVK